MEQVACPAHGICQAANFPVTFCRSSELELEPLPGTSLGGLSIRICAARASFWASNAALRRTGSAGRRPYHLFAAWPRWARFMHSACPMDYWPVSPEAAGSCGQPVRSSA